MHCRAAFGGKARTFDRQILDQNNRIALAQRLTVAVPVRAVLGDVIRPSAGLVIEIELIGQITRPIGL